MFYYKAAAGTEFISGNLYHYNIKVNASGLTVTSSIEDWKGIEKTTDGTAEME